MPNYVGRKSFCDTLTENVFTQRAIRNCAWIYSLFTGAPCGTIYHLLCVTLTTARQSTRSNDVSLRTESLTNIILRHCGVSCVSAPFTSIPTCFLTYFVLLPNDLLVCWTVSTFTSVYFYSVMVRNFRSNGIFL